MSEEHKKDVENMYNVMQSSEEKEILDFLENLNKPKKKRNSCLCLVCRGEIKNFTNKIKEKNKLF